ncbi:hypothetical protein [Enterococcus saccharolyticus]|uniref:hypothetical protein n=1 Tax=Enterococcus saccharolyticus TaxID=41997 RepID=UPI0039E0BD08
MKKLIFIPYQDIFDFSNTGILTREYSILKFFMDNGIEDVLFISKPRTILDKKNFKDINFPKESIEYAVYKKIMQSKKIRYETAITLSLFTKKRSWWIEGYEQVIEKIKKMDLDYKNTIVYSNNPFSYKLFYFLKNKGATIYFDMMDNLALHPSLSKQEQESANYCYRESFTISDFCTCNSQAISKYCEENFSRHPAVVKNGVFPIKTKFDIVDNNIKEKLDKLDYFNEKYKLSMGYIGKLGLRLDHELIENIVVENPNILFVFVGPHLSGQRNKKLEILFEKYENLLSLGSIPSAYINHFLNKFSVLMIPHSVGSYENGGDPLKLYQYLNTQKPIISTGIEGVNEFENIITISNDISDWNRFIAENLVNNTKPYNSPESIYWHHRLAPVSKFLKMEEKGFE